MRYLAVIIICMLQHFCFSQEKMSYYFDRLIVTDVKDYGFGFFGKIVSLTSSKDSTYSMVVRIKKDLSEGSIHDRKKRLMIRFESVTHTGDISDLNKLQNFRYVRHTSYHSHAHRHGSDFEDVEYENDSINNQTIVHLTSYKNKKKRKIASEHYYFFNTGANVDSTFTKNRRFQKQLIDKYNIDFIPQSDLVKTLCLVKGKINSQTEILAMKNVDLNFAFEAREVDPLKFYIK